MSIPVTSSFLSSGTEHNRKTTLFSHSKKYTPTKFNNFRRVFVLVEILLNSPAFLFTYSERRKPVCIRDKCRRKLLLCKLQ